MYWCCVIFEKYSRRLYTFTIGHAQKYTSRATSAAYASVILTRASGPGGMARAQFVEGTTAALLDARVAGEFEASFVFIGSVLLPKWFSCDAHSSAATRLGQSRVTAEGQSGPEAQRLTQENTSFKLTAVRSCAFASSTDVSTHWATTCERTRRRGDAFAHPEPSVQSNSLHRP